MVQRWFRKALTVALSSTLLLTLNAWGASFQGQAQEVTGCKMSDLSITANLPDGYTRIPMECPMVGYNKLVEQYHALGFYFSETPMSFSSSLDKLERTDFVDSQIRLTQILLEQEYSGQRYRIRRIDDPSDYPASIVESGGACGSLEIKHPISLGGREGVERRKGVICLSELPPTGSEKWALINLFFFEMNLDPARIDPAADFDQIARRLFRSVRVNN